MSTVYVNIPVTGVYVVAVELEEDAYISDEDLIEQALSEPFDMANLEEIEQCEKVVEGNVFYGLLDEAFVDRGD